MRKNIKKKSKNDKKGKHVSISNKNNINIKISTAQRRRSSTQTNGKSSIASRPDSLPQYSTYTQYNPPAPPKPEYDYEKYAKDYLKKGDKKHFYLEDGKADDKAPPKETPSKEKKRYTPAFKKLSAKAIKRGPIVVLDSFESLMKVKTIKDLKEIFRKAGVPDRYINLLKNKNKEEFIREYLARRKTEPALAPEPIHRPPSRETSDFFLSSDDETPSFQSQAAKAGGDITFQDQRALAGDFYDGPRFTPKPTDSPQSLIKGLLRSTPRVERKSAYLSDSDGEEKIYPYAHPPVLRENPMFSEIFQSQQPTSGGAFIPIDQTATTAPESIAVSLPVSAPQAAQIPSRRAYSSRLNLKSPTPSEPVPKTPAPIAYVKTRGRKKG